jgi:hypothetical protein
MAKSHNKRETRMATETKKTGTTAAKKTEDWTSDTAEVKAYPKDATVAGESTPQVVAAAKAKKTKKPRTPLTTRLAAAPTPARRAIIIEEQLKLVDKRRASIIKLADADTLAQVDPALLRA